MNYYSTRDKNNICTASQAILGGLAADGGLYLPAQIPTFSKEELENLCGADYREVAFQVLSRYLTDFSSREILDCIAGAYSQEKFDTDSPVELSKLGDKLYALELWHGPTCAFKDMALQMLPYLMRTAANHCMEDRKIHILVATSGDTGKAALEGFKDVPGVCVSVFYPEDGVSRIQKLQMSTQQGKNVYVHAIRGNFDDAQTAVKQIFVSQQCADALKEKGQVLSSANSINWGRLLPQIIYYVYTYTQLRANGELDSDAKFDVCVPTGNFGNILAAYYARQMGVPIEKLICASNKNHILTDFISTGEYNKNRPFYLTSSPSMDILISSNLERLLFLLGGEDDKKIKALYKNLKQGGVFEIDAQLLQKMQQVFVGYWTSEEECAQTIDALYQQYGYVCDPHTAVAMCAAERWQGKNICVVASTASPYKFGKSVLNALGEEAPEDEFEVLNRLSAISGVDIPPQLAGLKDMPVRFCDVWEKEDVFKAVLSEED